MASITLKKKFRFLTLLWRLYTTKCLFTLLPLSWSSHPPHCASAAQTLPSSFPAQGFPFHSFLGCSSPGFLQGWLNWHELRQVSSGHPCPCSPSQHLLHLNGLPCLFRRFLPVSLSRSAPPQQAPPPLTTVSITLQTSDADTHYGRW